MIKYILATILTCSSVAYCTIPDLKEVMKLVRDEKTEEAYSLFYEKFDVWITDNSLTADDYITLHFFEAWLSEKLGNQRADGCLCRAFFLWMWQDFYRKKENPSYTSDVPQNLGKYHLPDRLRDAKKRSSK